jgi:DNA repair protein RecN (Recombination protein N)
MLIKLSVHNYAIIQNLDLELDKGLVILTGETGSGKSILLGALGLIMGDRADTKVVYDPSSKCVVEATFDLTGLGLQEFFEANELEYETYTIIRREINPNGKTRAFVNDSPVNLQTLQVLAEQLVDLHQQFDTLSISQEKFQLEVVDAIGQCQALADTYKSQFIKWQQADRQLEKLKAMQLSAEKELDFIKFQYEELEQVNLKEEEQEALEEEQKMLGSAEEIKKQAGICFQLLSENEYAALRQLETALHAMNPLRSVHKDVDQLAERLDSQLIELQDICRELENVFEQTEHDPLRLSEVEERLNLIYKLQKKHQVVDVQGLIQIQNDLKQQLNAYTSIEEDIKQAEKELASLQKELEQSGKILMEARRAAFPIIEDKIANLLSKVNMANARIHISTQPFDKYQITGPEKITFLFSSNKGSKMQLIKDVASGGEMSRLALCIKSVVGNALALPTMIFDEIDTGVSGQVALQMSEILKSLAAQHQVIVITHTPQVAARADNHFVVFKEVTQDRTYTKIKKLSQEDRVHQLAVMLSTDPPTEAALLNAKELISI